MCFDCCHQFWVRYDYLCKSYSRNRKKTFFCVFSFTTRRRCFQTSPFFHRRLQPWPIINHSKFGSDRTFHRKVIRVLFFWCETSESSRTLPPPISCAMRHLKKLLIPWAPQLVHRDLTKFEGDRTKTLGGVSSNTIAANSLKSPKNRQSTQDGGFPVGFGSWS